MQTGTKLGPYEILAPLGAGGMGEVYRARDGRLDREVAVKILPAAVAGDASRLRRFETEARSAGQLNHPNILAVHDFGVSDGTPFLVTELLEGETLRERLTPPAALPPRKAVEIAAQVARGLAAAHGKGIVHRDLKPENIFLTRDGHVKIVDFGLAKSVAAVSDDAVTVAAGEVTSAGQVLGTASYMSPEQARGGAVDARSDLFALGAILYEMLAGRRAFQRETAAETMTAVLKEEPPALALASGALDPGLQRIVDHCLEKDPAARFQSARDLEFALAALGGSSATGRIEAAAPAAPRRGFPAAAAAVITAVVVGGAAFFLTRPAPAPLWHFTAITNYAGVQAEPALSPDGRSVAFTSNQDGHYNIYVALLSGGSPVEITHDANVKAHPAWSPDGSTLAYARADHGGMWDVWEVPALGGTPRRVILNAAQPGFAPNGDLVYANMADGAVWEASPTGENARRLAPRPAGYGGDIDPRVSPNGRLLAFTAINSTGGPYQQLFVENLANATTKALAGTGSLATSPAWAPGSRSIYFASNRTGAVNIWNIGVDGSGLRQITNGQGDDISLDVSADGKRILFGTMRMAMTLAEMNLQAPIREQAFQVLHVDPARWLWAPRYSPDGKRLTYFTALKGVRNEGIGVANADGSGAVNLVDDGQENVFPQWMPDGQSVVFDTIHPFDKGDVGELRIVPVGGGSPRVLSRPPNPSDIYSDIGRDGRVLLRGKGAAEAFEPNTGHTARLGPLPPRAIELRWSPDQRQVAYLIEPAREDDPAAGIWVTDFHAPPRQVFRGWSGWLAAAHGALYYLQCRPDLTGVLWRAGWNGAGAAAISAPIPLLWYDNFRDTNVGPYFDVSPDGRQLVFQVQPGMSENIGLLTLGTSR